MRARALAPALLLAAVAAAAPLRAQSLDEARAALRSGRYDDALAAYRALAGRPDAPAEAHRGLAETLTVVGKYADAERGLRAALAAHPDAPLRDALGEVLEREGRLDEAEGELRRAAEGSGDDRWTGRLHLGELLWRRGKRDEAFRLFDGFIDLYNGGGRLSSRELTAVGQAVRHLAVKNPQLHHDALKALEEAERADPTDPLPTLLIGELFLEKYVSPEAHASFKKVLDRNPKDPRALLDEARALDFDGDGGAMALVQKALDVNPSYVPARAFLARLELTLEDRSEGRKEAERALAVDSTSAEALAAVAAADWMAGDQAGFDTARRRALALDPHDGELLTAVAEAAEQGRRYAQAVELAGEAVKLDSLSSHARGVLGMNQLRTGAIAEGTKTLEAAFAADPFNPWYKNTLDLLDTFKRYEIVQTPHFHLVLRSDEAELLAPYVSAVAEEAWDSLSARYPVPPPTPVRVEVFPNHADFSVRTLGVPGLGALGVSFGPVLVMDSPSAREPGDFNWASTLWHELSHSFHMAATDHRVPRWFTEGLAVYEQRRARQGWGNPATVQFFQAWRAGRLHPPSSLSQGFLRPDYPEQVIQSYYEASLVFDMITEQKGFGAILAMLQGYKEGRTTEQVVRSALGMDMDTLDRTFKAWVEGRFADALASTRPLPDATPSDAPLADVVAAAQAHPDNFPLQLRAGHDLLEAGRLDEAEEHLKAATRLFPEYGGPDGPWLWLGRLHQERGEKEKAAAALAQHTGRVEDALAANEEEATVREALGDDGGAARALERAVTIYPYDADVHRHLATLDAKLGRREGAVRERGAVVALKPVDVAEARYQLALAEMQAGETEAARRHVLQALETAPDFQDAQELLLKLVGGGP